MALHRFRGKGAITPFTLVLAVLLLYGVGGYRLRHQSLASGPLIPIQARGDGMRLLVVRDSDEIRGSPSEVPQCEAKQLATSQKGPLITISPGYPTAHISGAGNSQSSTAETRLGGNDPFQGWSLSTGSAQRRNNPDGPRPSKAPTSAGSYKPSNGRHLNVRGQLPASQTRSGLSDGVGGSGSAPTVSNPVGDRRSNMATTPSLLKPTTTFSFQNPPSLGTGSNDVESIDDHSSWQPHSPAPRYPLLTPTGDKVGPGNIGGIPIGAQMFDSSSLRTALSMTHDGAEFDDAAMSQLTTAIAQGDYKKFQNLVSHHHQTYQQSLSLPSADGQGQSSKPNPLTNPSPLSDVESETVNSAIRDANMARNSEHLSNNLPSEKTMEDIRMMMSKAKRALSLENVLYPKDPPSMDSEEAKKQNDPKSPEFPGVKIEAPPIPPPAPVIPPPVVDPKAADALSVDMTSNLSVGNVTNVEEVTVTLINVVQVLNQEALQNSPNITEIVKKYSKGLTVPDPPRAVVEQDDVNEEDAVWRVALRLSCDAWVRVKDDKFLPENRTSVAAVQSLFELADVVMQTAWDSEKIQSPVKSQGGLVDIWEGVKSRVMNLPPSLEYMDEITLLQHQLERFTANWEAQAIKEAAIREADAIGSDVMKDTSHEAIPIPLETATTCIMDLLLRIYKKALYPYPITPALRPSPPVLPPDLVNGTGQITPNSTFVTKAMDPCTDVFLSGVMPGLYPAVAPEGPSPAERNDTHKPLTPAALQDFCFQDSETGLFASRYDTTKNASQWVAMSFRLPIALNLTTFAPRDTALNASLWVYPSEDFPRLDPGQWLQINDTSHLDATQDSGPDEANPPEHVHSVPPALVGSKWEETGLRWLSMLPESAFCRKKSTCDLIHNTLVGSLVVFDNSTRMVDIIRSVHLTLAKAAIVDPDFPVHVVHGISPTPRAFLQPFPKLVEDGSSESDGVEKRERGSENAQGRGFVSSQILIAAVQTSPEGAVVRAGAWCINNSVFDSDMSWENIVCDLETWASEMEGTHPFPSIPKEFQNTHF